MATAIGQVLRMATAIAMNGMVWCELAMSGGWFGMSFLDCFVFEFGRWF